VLFSALGLVSCDWPSPYAYAPSFNTASYNELLSQINPAVAQACSNIQGIGSPILGVKEALKGLDNSLKLNGFDQVQVIFFKQGALEAQTKFKLVLRIVSSSGEKYLGVEGLDKKLGSGYQFEITTYYQDSSIVEVRKILEEPNINTNGFVNCGDIKSTYSASSPVNNAPNGNSGSNGRNQGGSSGRGSGSGVDPDLIAQIIKLMQKSN